MEQTEFSAHRVLLLGPKHHSIQVLRSVLAIIGVGKSVHVEETAAALDLLTMEHFHAVLCVLKADSETDFVMAARRRNAMLNPTIPIFLMLGMARRPQGENARDSGATDVLTTPISPRTLAAKLRGATKHPRPFIVAQEFFGPDRRSKARPAFFGDDRRKKTPKKMRYELTQI